MKKIIAMVAMCSVLALVFVGMAQAETLLSVPADPQGNRVFTGNYVYKSVGAASSLLEAGFAEADGRGNLVITGIANMGNYILDFRGELNSQETEAEREEA